MCFFSDTPQEDVNGEKLTVKKWWIFGVPIFSRFTQSFSRFIRDINGDKKQKISLLMIFSRLVFHGLPPLAPLPLWKTAPLRRPIKRSVNCVTETITYEYSPEFWACEQTCLVYTKSEEIIPQKFRARNWLGVPCIHCKTVHVFLGFRAFIAGLRGCSNPHTLPQDRNLKSTFSLRGI